MRLACDRLGRARVVAGQHDDSRNAAVLNVRWPPCNRASRYPRRPRAQRTAVGCHVHRRLAFTGHPSHCRSTPRWRCRVRASAWRCRAGLRGLDAPPTPWPGMASNSLASRTATLRAFAPLTIASPRGCSEPRSSEAANEHGRLVALSPPRRSAMALLGDRSGLVEDDRIQSSALCNASPGADQDAVFDTLTDADSERSRCCEPQCTGAGDDQRRHQHIVA